MLNFKCVPDYSALSLSYRLQPTDCFSSSSGIYYKLINTQHLLRWDWSGLVP